jgi:hypothetical protein
MMNRLFVFLLFVQSFFFLQDASARLHSTDPPSSRVPWFSEQQLESPFLTDTNYVDTTLTLFQQYDPLTRHNLFMAHKGNIGHVASSMLFKPDLNTRFSLFPDPLYPGLNLDHDNVRFYRPEYVFTDLFLVIGENREQFFVARHNQRFHENLYVGAQYQIVNSPGFYNRLGARNSNIRVHFDFTERTGRYQALGSLVFNRLNNQESGGLADHEAFEANPDLEAVILNSAVSRYRENAFTLNHFYQTGFYLDQSNDTITNRRFINLGRINHNFSYRRISFVFNETAQPYDGFYETDPVFNLSTYDSTRVHMLENEVSWSNYPLQSGSGTFPFNFRLFLKHRLVQVQQPDLPAMLDLENDEDYFFETDQFNQLVPGIEVESDQNRFLSARGSASLTIGGYNDGDTDIGGSMRLGAPRHRHSLRFTAHYAEKEAPYFLAHFRGNYISWENNFEKTQWLQGGAIYSNPYLSLEGNYYLVKNMVFMGPGAMPVQNTSTVNVFTAGFRSAIGIGAFQTRHHVVYQWANDQQFERFPELAGRHSLFFDFYMFQRALGVQTGIDLSYNMAYSPMGYMPVVRQFYAQDEFPGRDNLMVDVFANFKISRARIFVKMENVAGLLLDVPPVYYIPFYPIPQASFKFGVSWMFFN